MLSTVEVVAIKKRLWNGDNTLAIAKEYGVTRNCIQCIYRGATWPQIPWPDGLQGHMIGEGHKDMTNAPPRTPWKWTYRS